MRELHNWTDDIGVVDFGQEIIQTNIYNKTMLFEQKFEFPT